MSYTPVRRRSSGLPSTKTEAFEIMESRRLICYSVVLSLAPLGPSA